MANKIKMTYSIICGMMNMGLFDVLALSTLSTISALIHPAESNDLKYNVTAVLTVIVVLRIVGGYIGYRLWVNSTLNKTRRILLRLNYIIGSIAILLLIFALSLVG